MKTKNGKFAQPLLGSAVVGLALLALPERAEAQEILLTGPLAGAPAVRKLRLYREGRFEFAPAVTFTLLDEYQRTILLGARLQYNFTDWLGIGAWGAYGGLLQLPTALTEHIQDENVIRRQRPDTDLERRLTALNLGPDFKDQLGGIEWVVSPQITAVPFRGKLALFQSIYLDTDLYFFGGPAFIGLEERGNCETACGNLVGDFPRATRTAIAPTFGLGFTFYMAKWAGLGFEWRGLPFAWNTGGFDTAGGGKDQEFPDNKILTVSFNIYLPTQYRISE
jgi:hypothetical protein